jgi:aspartyl-tRNA(Asn)/glutamyl-tRNA(Gln) amidotransferase subunit A
MPETDSSVAQTQSALAAAENPQGQGPVIFTRLYRDAALAAAKEADERRGDGRALSPVDGWVVSIKDLFDVAGETTEAGAPALAGEPPATQDAEIVRRLKAAGAVIVGKTNMTQFALSGLGLNPHRGTPLSSWRREEGRIAGGSSSGAAASVADGMARAAIGTDTGGSVRIPAAFCGLVGFKPTASRVSRTGAFALSPSLDSVGPIALSVRACAMIDAIIADGSDDTGSGASNPIRLGLPQSFVLEDMDPTVTATFAAALERLDRAGIKREDSRSGWLTDIPAVNATGGFSPIEGWAEHRFLFERLGASCDPLVMKRFRAGNTARATDYYDMLKLRKALIEKADFDWAPFDAIAFPTVAVIPPRLDELATDDTYATVNLRVLRNAAVVNLLDRCAITLPCHQRGEAPVGFMLTGPRGGDRALLALAARLEPIIAPA